jgi:GNAT superfamily N-acetyltransferase
VIERCSAADVPRIHELINEAAQAYRGVIPADQWHEPYMPMEELQAELSAGVEFWGYRSNGPVEGVMGLQQVKDVALIRHAYTLTRAQGRGIGSALLEHLKRQTERAMLVGTWKAATWAVRFYQGRGFRLVGDDEKSRLLKKYWTISERQVDESVVLVLG